MRSRPAATSKLTRVLPTLVVSCLMLGLRTQARAECTTKTYRLSLPDRATLKLADGEHKIGAVDTDHGSLEARVNVKGKDISAIHFFIGGRALSEVAESALPQDLRDCLKKAPPGPPSSEGWLARAAHATLDWIVEPAHASVVRDDWWFEELCFKGTATQQTCTYKACYSNGVAGTTTCIVLFPTVK